MATPPLEEAGIIFISIYMFQDEQSMIKESSLFLFLKKIRQKLKNLFRKENQANETDYINPNKNRNPDCKAFMLCFMPEYLHTNKKTNTSS